MLLKTSARCPHFVTLPHHTGKPNRFDGFTPFNRLGRQRESAQRLGDDARQDNTDHYRQDADYKNAEQDAQRQLVERSSELIFGFIYPHTPVQLFGVGNAYDPFAAI